MKIAYLADHDLYEVVAHGDELEILLRELENYHQPLTDNTVVLSMYEQIEQNLAYDESTEDNFIILLTAHQLQYIPDSLRWPDEYKAIVSVREAVELILKDHPEFEEEGTTGYDLVARLSCTIQEIHKKMYPVQDDIWPSRRWTEVGDNYIDL